MLPVQTSLYSVLQALSTPAQPIGQSQAANVTTECQLWHTLSISSYGCLQTCFQVSCKNVLASAASAAAAVGSNQRLKLPPLSDGYWHDTPSQGLQHHHFCCWLASQPAGGLLTIHGVIKNLYSARHKQSGNVQVGTRTTMHAAAT